MSNATLYIIVRRDMASMTPGRVAAMASHATSYMNKCTNEYESTFRKTSKVFNEWIQETDQEFGTAIILETHNWEAFKEGMYEEIECLCTLGKKGELCGIVNDPTYAVRDGQIIHFLPVETCAFVLCDKGSNIQKVFEDLNLYSGK